MSKKTDNVLQDPFTNRESTKYRHPIPSREFILDYIADRTRPLTRKQLAAALKLESSIQQEAFRRRIRAMVRDGQLCKSRDGKYTVMEKAGMINGRVSGHRDGFGFLMPEDGTSKIFLSAREMRKVFDGDLITVRVTHVDREGRREAKIVRVIEHKRQQIVGRFFVESGVGFVEPDNNRINQDIVIPSEEQLGAQPGQIVAAEIVIPPTTHTSAIARIVEILGDYLSPGMEIEMAIRSYGLPYQFSRDVIDEADKLKDKITEKDLVGRRDLRHLPFVTIDGSDAKDFDDAVYCEPREKEGWRLYVAIADVSHYVKPNTVLDKVAQERGNSVYFPRKVIPMLPESLSNGVCSLKPNVDRLCMVCDMAVDQAGKVIRYRFYDAVIKSRARCIYEDVANVLSDSPDPVLSKQYENLLPYLKHLEDIYRQLLNIRHQNGALRFETTEYKAEFDETKKIKCIYPVERNEAHKIIEECMLVANICAAKFLMKHKCSALYRVHDSPSTEKVMDLREFLGELGLTLGGGELPVSKDFALVLDQLADRPDAHLIQTVLLRSLKQAFYSSVNDGHFGLAFEHYTHFTSPIRRYPDLIVHRAIRAELNKKPCKQLIDDERLQKLGEYCSMTERRADEATREALTFLKCEYMLDKLGAEFKGIISKVTGFGVFVELCDLYIDGLVHIGELQGDHYMFDSVRHRLVGKRTGKVYSIGDMLTVQVARVSLEDKQIDFVLANRSCNKSSACKK